MSMMNYKNSEVKRNEKPQIFFKSVTFNDGTELSLDHNSIVVFTGANNSGKSQNKRETLRKLS